VLCAVLWSSNVIVAKLIADDIPPFTLSLGRNLVAFLASLPLALMERPTSAAFRENALTLLIAGSIGTGFFNALVYHGLATTSAINAVMVMSLVPAVVPAISFVLVRERLHRAQALGIVLSLLGVLWIVTQGQPAALFFQQLVIGDAQMFCAMLCWSTYTVLVRRRSSALGPYTFFSGVVAVACLALLPFAVWEWRATNLQVPSSAWLAVVYIGIVPSGIAMILFNRAVQVVGANLAGVFQHLVPICGTLMAIGFLGERFGAYHAAGGALIAAGIFAATRAPRIVGTEIRKESPAPR